MRPSSAKAHPVNILVVDDVPAKLIAMEALLSELQANVVCVQSGADALRQLLQREFAVILLDVNMPGIDGFEVLKRLRALHISSRVLMLTARGEVSDRVTGLELGADDYLAKPFAMQELVARVRALSRRFSEEPAIEGPARMKANARMKPRPRRSSAYITIMNVSAPTP